MQVKSRLLLFFQSVIQEKDDSQGDQDSFGSVDLAPYMNTANSQDSADRSKKFSQNGKRTAFLSDINTKREAIKPVRNAVSEYSVSPCTLSLNLRVCLFPLSFHWFCWDFYFGIYYMF